MGIQRIEGYQKKFSKADKAMQKLGVPPAIEDVISPALLLVEGMELNMRTDWRVTPNGEPGGQDVADALNYRLNQAERLSRADQACSDAFRPQIGCGLIEGDAITAERTIVINRPETDERGYAYLSNDLQRTRLKVILDDVPTTAGFREQQFQFIIRSYQVIASKHSSDRLAVYHCAFRHAV